MPRELQNLLARSWQKFQSDKCARLGAALSYYSVFSLAPILVIAIAVAGFFFGREAVEGTLYEQIDQLIGAKNASMVQELVRTAYRPGAGIVASLISVMVLFLGATGVFVELQGALDTIWGVTRNKSGGILKLIRDRWLSLTMVFGIGFLLLVSLVLSTVIVTLISYFSAFIVLPPIAMLAINYAVSIAILTALFALIFKILPGVNIRWRDMWLGAFVTAVLFTIGKELISLYIGQTSFGSSFGAAGSLVVILFWTYYSAQIVLFGAEVTEVYSEFRGHQPECKPGYTFLEDLPREEHKEATPLRDSRSPQLRASRP